MKLEFCPGRVGDVTEPESTATAAFGALLHDAVFNLHQAVRARAENRVSFD